MKQPKKQPPTVHVQFRLRADLHARLVEACRNLPTSPGQFARDALEDWIEENLPCER
jgi:hypothetical protein